MKREYKKTRISTLSICAEKLFRQAEDEFFHYEQPAKAFFTIEKALTIRKGFAKALILKGDICTYEGETDEAIKLYKKAIKASPTNPRALASLACCYDLKEHYKLSLDYCNRAFEYMSILHMDLYPSLYELKLSLLVKLRDYKQAYHLLDNSMLDLTVDEITFLKACNHQFIKRKLELAEKVKLSSLKVI